MGGRSSSSSSTSTTTTTKTRNINLSGNQGVSLAGNDQVEVTVTPGESFQVADNAVVTAGSVTLKALDIAQRIQEGALAGAKEFAEQVSNDAFDFARQADQPDGGAVVKVVMWLALGGAVAAVGLYLVKGR